MGFDATTLPREHWRTRTQTWINRIVKSSLPGFKIDKSTLSLAITKGQYRHLYSYRKLLTGTKTTEDSDLVFARPTLRRIRKYQDRVSNVKLVYFWMISQTEQGSQLLLHVTTLRIKNCENRWRNDCWNLKDSRSKRD